jgi:fermentation-respiration switch protein FrsA (DUF1100 family)
MFRQPKYVGPERRKQPRWRPRPLRVLLTLLIIAAVGYATVVLWLITQETRLVFQAGATLAPTRPPFPYEQVDIGRHDGTQQFAWVMQQRGSDTGTWVLFLHGNAATIASRVNIARYAGLRKLGVSVIAPEYRGFAGLDGVPTESSLTDDARSAYSYLRARRGIAPSRIVVYGWSLGSAVAVDLTSKVDEAAVVLEGAPASLVDIGSERYPFFPVRLLMRNPFDSIRKVDSIHSPILFLHSPDDTVIPISEGRRLYEAARTEKTFVEVRGGHVNSADEDPERFFGAIRAFFAQHHLIDDAAGVRAGSDQGPTGQ